MTNKYLLTLLVALSILFNACKEPDPLDIPIPGKIAELTVYRLDSAIFITKENDLPAMIADFYAQYPYFANIYLKSIIKVGDTTLPAFYNNLNMFRNDNDMLQTFKDAYLAYKNFDSYAQQLSKAFTYYKYYFPEKTIPAIIPCMTGYNYAVLAADSVLGIGMEMFMGKYYKYYAMIGFPLYKIEIMDSSHIATETIKAWIQTEFFEENESADLLTRMIDAGKILYITEALLPQTKDATIIGYTDEQWKWCETNKTNMWAHWVDNKLLYSTNNKDILKYLNEGPFTTGFPRESPSRTATWMGWMIVKAYMQKQTAINLQELIETDTKTILKQSKFKP
jgi:hypothetical protein